MARRNRQPEVDRWPEHLREFVVDEWDDGFVPVAGNSAARNGLARSNYASWRWYNARVDHLVENGSTWLSASLATDRIRRRIAERVLREFEAANPAEALAEDDDGPRPHSL